MLFDQAMGVCYIRLAHKVTNRTCTSPVPNPFGGQWGTSEVTDGVQLRLLSDNNDIVNTVENKKAAIKLV